MDGTVEDNPTGLTWQQKLEQSLFHHAFDDARSYCAGLDLAGGGWRVPSVKELLTLADFEAAPGAPLTDAEAFPATPQDAFWTSSPIAGIPGAAWIVGFSLDTSSQSAVTDTHYVRCGR